MTLEDMSEEHRNLLMLIDRWEVDLELTHNWLYHLDVRVGAILTKLEGMIDELEDREIERILRDDT